MRHHRCAKSAVIIILLVYAFVFMCVAFAMPQDVPFTLSGSAEFSTLMNSGRKCGGNEVSLGDYFLNVNLSVQPSRNLDFTIDWVPESVVLDCADPSEWNYHSHNWLRADGYVSRPSLLPKLTATIGKLSFGAGAFKVCGLESLTKSSKYYLSDPAPILHSTHYGKGFRLSYNSDYLFVETSVVDGDWAIGEPDIFSLHNSAANSYPSYGGRFEARSSAFKLGRVAVGASGSFGDLGSFPGQKRRQNNAVGYLRYDYEDLVTLRSYLTYMERNPFNDGSGNHVDSIDTIGYGVDLAIKNIEVLWMTLDFQTSIWRMTTNDSLDGEIWIYDGVHKYWGWSAGVRVNNPAFLYQDSYIGFQVSQVYLDSHVSLLGGDRIDLFLISFGINW